MKHRFNTDEGFARELDSEDPLARFRQRFHEDGNSLGLLCKDSESSLLPVPGECIEGWLEAKRPWSYFAEELGAMRASLVGAKPKEVVLSGTTTVNVHHLVNSFYAPRGKRKKMIAHELDFPQTFTL